MKESSQCTYLDGLARGNMLKVTFVRILIVKVKVKGWDAENQKEAETCQRVVRRSVEWQ